MLHFSFSYVLFLLVSEIIPFFLTIYNKSDIATVMDYFSVLERIFKELAAVARLPKEVVYV